MPKKTNNYKTMKEDELAKELSQLEEKKRFIRFKSEGSKSKNVKETAALRKQIAQVLTELNNKNQRLNKKK